MALAAQEFAPEISKDNALKCYPGPSLASTNGSQSADDRKQIRPSRAKHGIDGHQAASTPRTDVLWIAQCPACSSAACFPTSHRGW